MTRKISSMFFMVIAFLVSCNTNQQSQQEFVINNVEAKVASGSDKTDKANQILNQAIEAHGGTLYNKASYSFVFRGKTYSFSNKNGDYEYGVKSNTEEGQVQDFIKNGSFVRYINEKEASLSQKDVDKYSEALNSVIYFTTLPYKLQDKAVNKSYKGVIGIKGKDYDILEITFNKEGGGKDYDDEFYYWINSDTKKIDYLAYSYSVNNGGVRFRSAFNTRVIDGVTFQDYVNYKSNVGTPLKDLPVLYEKGQLKELSRIITENVINLNTQK